MPRVFIDDDHFHSRALETPGPLAPFSGWHRGQAFNWLGPLGNVQQGGSTLTVWHPHTDGMVDYGETTTPRRPRKFIATDCFQCRAGTGTDYFNAGGVIDIDTTAVGNVGLGADDLITYTMPANTLVNDGDSLEIIASGEYGAGVQTKQLILYFGATAIYDTGGVGAQGAADWQIRATVTKTGASTQHATAAYATDGTAIIAGAEESTPAEDETGAIVIKCTGQYLLAVNDEVVQNFMKVVLHPAPP